MNVLLLVLPIVLPILGGAVLPLFPWKRRQQRNIYVECIVIATSILMWTSLLLHPSSYTRLINLAGILEVSVHLDGAGMVFAALVSTLWPFASLYAFEYMHGEKGENRFFSFYTMTYGITLGIAMSANLMTMYMFYEMLTLVTIPLVMHTMTSEARYAGRKYAYYSIGGAAFAFIGFIFILRYGTSMNFTFGGVLDMTKVSGHEPLLQAVFVCMVLGFGVKAALFPLHGWLPTASVAPTPVTALLHAVAVVKSGAFAILRITYYIFGTSFLRGTPAQYMVLGLVGISILFCSSNAVKEQHLKRRFAYSTASNLSYILFGFLLMTLDTVMMWCVAVPLMAIAAYVLKLPPIWVYFVMTLDEFEKMPVVFGCMSVAGIALIGIPPLTGFISKWNIATAAVDAYQKGNRLAPYLILILVLSAFLTAIYIFTILGKAYLVEPTDDDGKTNCDPGWQMKVPMVLFAILIVVFGLYSKPLMTFFTWVANGLL